MGRVPGLAHDSIGTRLRYLVLVLLLSLVAPAGPAEDGYVMEASEDDGTTWTVTFDGFYRRAHAE